MIQFSGLLKPNNLLSKIITCSFNFFFFFVRRIVKLAEISNGNVVVISLHKLGDTVFTIPAIHEIQKIYNKKIIIYCYPEAEHIYKLGLKNVEYCIVEHKNFFWGDRIANLKARKLLKSNNPEIIFDLTGVMTSSFLIFNSRARKIIGMSRLHFKMIYDQQTPIRNTPHLIDRYLDVVSLVKPEIDRTNARIFLCKTESVKRILIHPFAGWKAKEWGVNKFIKLSELLSNDFIVSIISPPDYLTADIFEDIKNRKFKTIITTSINELINNIYNCDLFIGNDSGPLHIANLLGKATFSILGPTNPVFHIPLGKSHDYIIQQLSCSAKDMEKLCITDGGRAGCPEFSCMKVLEVDQVYKKIRNLINKIDSNKNFNLENYNAWN